MAATTVDRRHHRRVDLPVAVSFRQLNGSGKASSPVTGSAKDVGLAGVYVWVPSAVSLPAGTQVSYTVEVPPEQQRQFPFKRLLGIGWVVRTDLQSDGKQTGVAIAFSPSTTVLSSVQP